MFQAFSWSCYNATLHSSSFCPINNKTNKQYMYIVPDLTVPFPFPCPFFIFEKKKKREYGQNGNEGQQGAPLLSLSLQLLLYACQGEPVCSVTECTPALSLVSFCKQLSILGKGGGHVSRVHTIGGNSMTQSSNRDREGLIP